LAMVEAEPKPKTYMVETGGDSNESDTDGGKGESMVSLVPRDRLVPPERLAPSLESLEYLSEPLEHQLFGDLWTDRDWPRCESPMNCNGGSQCIFEHGSTISKVRTCVCNIPDEPAYANCSKKKCNPCECVPCKSSETCSLRQRMGVLRRVCTPKSQIPKLG